MEICTADSSFKNWNTVATLGLSPRYVGHTPPQVAAVLTTPCRAPRLPSRWHCSSGPMGLWFESPGLSYNHPV